MSIGNINTESDLREFIVSELGDSDLAVLVRQLQEPEPWHRVGAANEPPFQNSWVNFDAAASTSRDARFYKADGRVHLAGVVKSGTGSVPMFTLPAGYRPDVTNLAFTIDSNGSVGLVTVALNGDVTLISGSSVSVFLDGISFRSA